MSSARSPLLLLLLPLLLSDVAFAFFGFDIHMSYCVKVPDTSRRCKKPEERFFHNATSRACESFSYFGCRADQNNYLTIKDCQKSCILAGKPGRCSWKLIPLPMTCSAKCGLDWDCPGKQKCCRDGCKKLCKDPA